MSKSDLLNYHTIASEMAKMKKKIPWVQYRLWFPDRVTIIEVKVNIRRYIFYPYRTLSDNQVTAVGLIEYIDS